MNYRFSISGENLRSFHAKLIGAACVIMLAHALAMFCKYGLDHHSLLGAVPLFDLYGEHNIPTYFSSINLLITSLLLYSVVRLNEAKGLPPDTAWQTLSVGFLFMSVDEFVDARLVLTNLAEWFFNGELMAAVPVLSVAWTIPALLIVIVLFFYFVPFLMRLPRRYLGHFLFAGFLFVLAAIGFETLQGHHVPNMNGSRDLYFSFLVTVEEFLEMFSILYFQYFLISYIEHTFFSLHVPVVAEPLAA